jgi:hypothetical protein
VFVSQERRRLQEFLERRRRRRRRRDHPQDQVVDDGGGGGGGGDNVGVVASRENQSLEKKIALRILNPRVMRITGEGRR